jgi:hypothetical protein
MIFHYKDRITYESKCNVEVEKMNFKKIVGITTLVLGVAFAVISAVRKKNQPNSRYENKLEEKNPLEGKKVIFVADDKEAENADGVRGHLEARGDSEVRNGIYEKYVKRGIDVVLSFCGLVVLSPVLLGITIAIKIDDPGPVLFTQKRMGQYKKYFKLHN